MQKWSPHVIAICCMEWVLCQVLAADGWRASWVSVFSLLLLFYYFFKQERKPTKPTDVQTLWVFLYFFLSYETSHSILIKMCVVWKGACFIYLKPLAQWLCRVPHNYSDIRQSWAPFCTPFFPPRTLQTSLLTSWFLYFLSPWLVRFSFYTVTCSVSLHIFHF